MTNYWQGGLTMADYIDREAVLMKLMQDGCSAKNVHAIMGMPAADVAPVVHGKWKITQKIIENAVCSNCGRHFQSYYEAYRYCPNCGAKMDKEDDGDADV